MIYAICDEVTQSLNIKDEDQCKTSTAEVMTFAILSAVIYGADYRKIRRIVSSQRYFSKVLSHRQNDISCFAL